MKARSIVTPQQLPKCEQAPPTKDRGSKLHTTCLGEAGKSNLTTGTRSSEIISISFDEDSAPRQTQRLFTRSPDRHDRLRAPSWCLVEADSSSVVITGKTLPATTVAFFFFLNQTALALSAVGYSLVSAPQRTSERRSNPEETELCEADSSLK